MSGAGEWRVMVSSAPLLLGCSELKHVYCTAAFRVEHPRVQASCNSMYCMYFLAVTGDQVEVAVDMGGKKGGKMRVAIPIEVEPHAYFR